MRHSVEYIQRISCFKSLEMLMLKDEIDIVKFSCFGFAILLVFLGLVHPEWHSQVIDRRKMSKLIAKDYLFRGRSHTATVS